MPYLVYEKPKVQRFLSCLPYHIKDRIEYDNPKTLEEAMRKSNFCYEQNRKNEIMANWKAKKNNNQYDQKKKAFVPNRNSKNNKAGNFLNKKISQEIRIIHQAIRIILRVKNLLITMVITPRNLSAKNL